MFLVFGVIVSLALKTHSVSTDADQRDRLARGTIDLRTQYAKLSDEVTKLREENQRYQNAMAKQSGQARVFNDSLQDAKLFAGLTDVVGPGVNVTLRDNKATDSSAPIVDQIIHDTDVLRVVNELWNAGAEAISVNANRITVGSSIRCVGSVILINNVQSAPPVVIRAIGDSKTLMGAMNLPGGIFDEIRRSGGPGMVQIEAVKKMLILAFSGSTSRRFAVAPKDKSK